MKKNPLSIPAALIAIAIASALSHGQGYLLTDTMAVQVIFYDFRADGSNPNFEVGSCGKKPGMVQDTLDADRKPVLKANLCYNDRIHEWYRPSGMENARFYYDQALKTWRWTDLNPYQGRTGEFTGPSFNPAYDMANIVIYDSLPFKLKDPTTGTYEFIRTQNSPDGQFFWLDERGWGNEGLRHNYSFTMELHHEFTYKGGEFFSFRGDDAVWVYINGILVMDLGGTQKEVSGSFNLDALAPSLGLVKGQQYIFDFFYNERTTSQASCVITTNLLTPIVPDNMFITPTPAPPDPRNPPQLPETTITAGECVTFHVWIFDDTLGLQPEWGQRVHWEIVDTLGNNIVLDTISSSNTFCLLRAHGCVKIYVTYSDPEFPDIRLRDSVIVCVSPGPPHHLTIEGNPNPTGAALRYDDPLPNLTLATTDSIGYGYAILRDQHGNFVSHSGSTGWSVVQGGTVISVAPGNQSLGQGIIRKLGPSGSASVEARSLAYSGAAFRDTLAVTVAQIAYSSLRIAVGLGGQRTRIDSLAMRMLSDTTLYVEGLRVDGLGWELIDARWALTSITTTTPPPASASLWQMRPTSLGSGRLSATFGAQSVSIPVTVLPGGPAVLDIYPRPGTPGAAANNIRYASPSAGAHEVAAGSTFPLVGKIFDPYGTWLSTYETDPVLGSRIRWEVRYAASGALVDTSVGTLTTTTGAISGFVPKRAFLSLYVISTFQEGALLLRDTVLVRTRAGTPALLVIEPSADSAQSPNRINPVAQVELLSTDTLQKVYAIVRDPYGNWIGPADDALWTSFDTSAVRVTPGIVALGEGIIRRVAQTRTQTWVEATSGALADSVLVVTDSIRYTALRIVVSAGGLRDVDTVRIRTDQDTILFALGRRSDNGQWVEIRVPWTSAGITLSPSAPSLADRYAFSPSQVGTALVTVSLGGVTDRVTIIALYSLPVRLELYPLAGTPDSGANRPYPPPTVIDTIIAGTDFAAVAKLFGSDGLWLRQYETADSPVVWRLNELSGSPPTGTLSTRTGYRTIFRPTRAGNTVELIAEYTTGTGQVVADAVRLYIKAGPVHHLVLEPTPDPKASPYADNPLGTLTIGRTDTVTYAYAVLRDLYGNFVRADSLAEWMSLSRTVADVRAGVKGLGEGIITRIADAGEALILAQNSVNELLRDTVLVTLATIGYDSLRIVVRDTMRINELVMRTDEDTALQVQGKRSDNGRWEPVGATWLLSPGLGSVPQPPHSADRWRFSPSDTGAGWIRVTLGNDAATIPDTVRVMFLAGRPLKLALYPKEGIPDANNQPYAPPATAVQVTAGVYVGIAAQIFDHNDVLLTGSVVRNDSISWRVEEISGNPPTGVLNPLAGRTTRFFPTRAHNTLLVIARYKEGNTILLDTVRFAVQPGRAHHLVIEANQNWQYSPNSDNPIDTVVITTMESYRRVYAVVRDTFGNFVDYSRRTEWGTRDSAIVTISDGIWSIGEGVIQRVVTGEDTTTAIAAQSLEFPGLADSAGIRILNIYFKELRIVVGSDTLPVSNLTISTNDDTTLRVIGRRSDNNEWMNIQTQWETSPGLGVDPAAPELDNTWRFSPTVPGSGWIRVTLGNDSISRPDTIFVTFTVGPPVRVEIQLLTPPEERIAGDTLVAVVRVRNKDGLIPGDDYCPQVAYQDLLGGGGREYLPLVIVDGESDTLRSKTQPFDSVEECFSNGIDTVKFVLFYAPFDPDSLNQLFVNLGGLQGSTAPFRLLPAGLDTIMVVNQKGAVFSDTTLRAPSDYLYVVSSGFDRFGNRIGNVVSNWRIEEGDLHALTRPDRTVGLYYSTEGVIYDERGCIEVEYADDPRITASFCVTILSPPAELRSATTRDASGNGYLDRIELRFSKAVTFGASYDLDDIRVINEKTSTPFMVDSIEGGLGRKDSVFILYLREEITSAPQTSWTPLIFVDGIPESDSVLMDTCRDGAGPVIWTVTKEIVDLDDRTTDIVTVVFSEPIQGGDESAFKISNPPASVFLVWTKAGPDSFVQVRGFLDLVGEGGRLGFLTIRSTTTLKFVMSNGNDLTANHYLSLRFDSSSAGKNFLVIDRADPANAPEKNNRKVQVVVEPERAREMKVMPNPARPGSPTDLSIEYDKDARRQVMQQGRGVLLSFPIVLIPGAELDRIDGALQIYDLAGNLVDRAECRDMLSTAPDYFRDGGVHNYDIYWSGYNEDGLRVAPGVYRAVLKIDYRDSHVQDRAFVATIGIRR